MAKKAAPPKSQVISGEDDEKANAQEFLVRLRDQQREIDQLKKEYLVRATEAKDAKMSWEVAQEELSEMVREDDPDNRPLFKQGGDAGDLVEIAAEGSDDWRSIKITKLNITPSITKALKENSKMPILTIGDLAEWSKKGNHLVDIAGIGEEKATAVEQALDRFWSEMGTRNP